MTTKTITLRAIDLLPGLGNEHDGIPFRWLTSLVEKARAAVPDDEEASCVVLGAQFLTFSYEQDVYKRQPSCRCACRCNCAQSPRRCPR